MAGFLLGLTNAEAVADVAVVVKAAVAIDDDDDCTRVTTKGAAAMAIVAERVRIVVFVRGPDGPAVGLPTAEPPPGT